MLKQQSREASPAASTPTWTTDTVILDWIDAWHPVREDLLRLLTTYKESDDGHDISRFLQQIDEVDTSIRLLLYRVNWLRSYLSHIIEKPLDKR